MRTWQIEKFKSEKEVLFWDSSRRKTGRELKEAFESLSSTHVFLGFIPLSQNNGREMKEAFGVLSATHVYLLGNDLWSKSGSELKEVFEGLSAATHVNLTGNRLELKTGAEREELINIILQSGKRIKISPEFDKEIEEQRKERRSAFLLCSFGESSNEVSPSIPFRFFRDRPLSEPKLIGRILDLVNGAPSP